MSGILTAVAGLQASVGAGPLPLSVTIEPATASGHFPGMTNPVTALPVGGREPYIFQWGTVSGTGFGTSPASNVQTVQFPMFDAVHRVGVMGVVVQDADGKQSQIATVQVTQN